MTQQQYSFYMRPLPESCIPFSSKQGKTLFKKAMEQGNTESFFPLIEQFRTQDNPAYCGLGTLVMMLNTLKVDPNQQWKASVWRYYDEEMLSCCIPLDTIQKQGITMDEFSCLARCHGAAIDQFRIDEGKVTIEQFRKDVKETCKTEEKQYLGISYSRKILGQTGDGHYSPIGAYEEETDSVLILDVARFKYPPYWVPLQLAWESMKPKDASTQRSRGYFKMSAEQHDRLLYGVVAGLKGRVTENAISMIDMIQKVETSLKCSSCAVLTPKNRVDYLKKLLSLFASHLKLQALEDKASSKLLTQLYEEVKSSTFYNEILKPLFRDNSQLQKQLYEENVTNREQRMVVLSAILYCQFPLEEEDKKKYFSNSSNALQSEVDYLQHQIQALATYMKNINPKVEANTCECHS